MPKVGTINVVAGADSEIASEVNPTLPPNTGGLTSLVSGALVKVAPVALMVEIGAASRRVAAFNASGASLTALSNRVIGSGFEAAAEFTLVDGQFAVNAGFVASAPAEVQTALEEIMSPKPVTIAKFAPLVAAIEKACEAVGFGAVVLCDQQDGNVRVYTNSPSYVDDYVEDLESVQLGDAAALGNGGGPIAKTFLSDTEGGTAKLPGE